MRKIRIDIYRWMGKCWRCGASTPLVYPESEILDVQDPRILSYLTERFPWVKKTFSKTLGSYVYGNTCVECGAYQGWWFVMEEWIELKTYEKIFPIETIEVEATQEEEEYFEAWEDLEICPLCGRKVLRLVGHHVSYDPEDIIYICNSCHAKIHRNKGAFIERRKDRGDRGDS